MVTQRKYSGNLRKLVMVVSLRETDVFAPLTSSVVLLDIVALF